MSEVLMRTDLPFPLRRGKVRDVYDLGPAEPRLLIVATDRISAFDAIMPDPIPGKGKILTALSAFWFRKFARQFDHHLISTEMSELPPPLRGWADQLRDRFMLVKKADVLPIECIARGYLAGSGWKEYRQTQSVCGIKLPPGLRPSDRLPVPIFTPATKAQSGHDQNITFEQMAARIGVGLADELRERTLRLYALAAEHAEARGILIADSKFEFGIEPETGRTILIDEILTPDSSRFWPANQYQPGREQPSFDKQFLRDWLEQQNWNKSPPAPRLPLEVIEGTRARYLQAYQALTAAT